MKLIDNRDASVNCAAVFAASSKSTAGPASSGTRRRFILACARLARGVISLRRGAAAACRNWAASRPTAASAAPRSKCSSAATAWPMPRKSCSTSRASRSTHLEAAGANAVKTKLAIAPDCRLGLHQLRVRTATGISNLRTFSVGALPEIKEVEPNNDFAAAAKDRARHDRQRRGRQRRRRLLRRRGQERASGSRPSSKGCGWASRSSIRTWPFSTPSGSSWPARDDAPLVRQDCVCSIVAPEDGTYIVQVRETSFAGNGSCLYRLHVGPLPAADRRAARWAASRAKRSTFTGWATCRARRAEKITLPATAAGRVRHVRPRRAGHRALGQSVSRRATWTTCSKSSRTTPWPKARACEAPVAMNGVIAQAGRRRLLQVPGQEGTDVRRSRAGPRASARRSIRC